MAQTTITITETVTRTYLLGSGDLDSIQLSTDDLPEDMDDETLATSLKEFDSDDLAVALIDSDLEDRYEVIERDLDIAQGRS